MRQRQDGADAVRPARAADAPRLAEIARAAYAPYVAAIGREPPPMLQDFPAAIAAGRVWVAGAPDGFVLAYAQGADWHVENLAVDPAAQGRGLGPALLAAAEAEGRARGHPRVTLYTNAAMAGALALYPRLGYTETDRRVEHGLSRVHFAKDLRAMADRPINLRRARKARARDAARAEADANAARHGQAKPVRRLAEARAEREARAHEAHRRERPAETPPEDDG